MKQNMTSLLVASLALAVSFPIASAYAQSPADIGGVMVYHFKPNGTVSGLDGIINLGQITDFMDTRNCDYSTAIVTIHTVLHNGISEVVAGFRTADDTLYRVSSDVLYANVSNAERHLIKDLFKRNQQVLASYSMCGSGGLISLTGVYKVSAIKGLDSLMNRRKVGSSLEGKSKNISINTPAEQTLVTLKAVSPQFSAGNSEAPRYPPSAASLVRKDSGR